MSLKKTLPLALALLASSQLHAATQFIFQVEANEYSGAMLDGSAYWAPTGNAHSFQATITIDESNYEYLLKDFGGVDRPVSNLGAITVSSPTNAAIEGFEQSFSDAGNSVTNNESNLSQYVDVGFVDFDDELDFRHSSTGQQTTPSDGGYQRDTFYEKFSIEADNLMSSNAPLPQFDDFLEVMLAQLGNGFYFEHYAGQGTEKCPTEHCTFASMTDFRGIKFSGTATLTGISEVPVPAAAWLFGSALLGLTGIKRRA